MNPPRIVFVGSVNTSRTTLESLLRNHCQVVGVLELASSASRHVSGFAPLADIVEGTNIPSETFEKINEPQVKALVERWQPDLLFVVGLSQLVGEDLLNLPTVGAVGFHPTRLPKGRGRAPYAWLSLGETEAAATFFLMDEGTDSGPILVQEPFEVSANDYASDIEQSIHDAIRRGLDRWLPQLNAGEWAPEPQDHSQATYMGKRTPSDGLIDWQKSATTIASQVRAASRPFPGAYTYLGDSKLIIWRASVAVDCNHHGVAGRVLSFTNESQPLIQTGDGALLVEEFELVSDSLDANKLRIGSQLGYFLENEVHRLRKKVASLEEQLNAVMERLNRRIIKE
ncbi:methionyl-tRNA formyltransferase [Aeoliella mucimassa]|uniref:Bifunctional polymyxin resistance protein ArnA n=1 Tax=Aeoliella mucimassa TaxID=2527972 RepID=A0A518AKT1_9BACT|nr:methionyl-tRNA formyltransferase [Aeoliella mucimassa]QDU55339.1 Bifunctional polymyxin resistance protein ArnA [Aeoliella mucimassa]